MEKPRKLLNKDWLGKKVKLAFDIETGNGRIHPKGTIYQVFKVKLVCGFRTFILKDLVVGFIQIQGLPEDCIELVEEST